MKELIDNRLYARNDISILKAKERDKKLTGPIYIFNAYRIGKSSLGKKIYLVDKYGRKEALSTYESQDDLKELVEVFDEEDRAITSLFEVARIIKDENSYTFSNKISNFYREDRFRFSNNGEVIDSKTERCLFFNVNNKELSNIRYKMFNLYHSIK